MKNGTKLLISNIYEIYENEKKNPETHTFFLLSIFISLFLFLFSSISFLSERLTTTIKKIIPRLKIFKYLLKKKFK